MSLHSKIVLCKNVLIYVRTSTLLHLRSKYCAFTPHVHFYTDFMLLLKYILNSILPHLYFYIAVLILLLTFPPMVTAKRQNFLKIL